MTTPAPPINDDGMKKIAEIVSKILQINATQPGEKPIMMEEVDIMQIIDMAIVALKQDKCALIDIEPPVTICGDTHGQLNDVIRLFETVGWAPKTRYLFLGDYVDRGPQNIETICLMFAYKIRFPEDFFILRGNHECPKINRVYGFYEECRRRYTGRLWQKFQEAFAYIPVAALVSNRIFCIHGGISPYMTSLDHLRTIPLPLELPEEYCLLNDLLWADPEPSINGFQLSPRGMSFIFGADAVKGFCNYFKVDLICRAHQVVENGFEFFADHKLVTIFSAPNYCGEFDNSAASLSVSPTMLCKIIQLKPMRTR